MRCLFRLCFGCAVAVALVPFVAHGQTMTAAVSAPELPDAPLAQAGQPAGGQQGSAAGAQQQSGTTAASGAQADQSSQTNQHEQAERDIKAQEKQRVLGMVPQFNATDNQNAVPLSAGQKYDLAFHSAIDPATFIIAGLEAGLSEAQNQYTGYGWGAQGYFKRWGASYADSFDSVMIGNAILPALLHQDPRYFRLGHARFADKGVSRGKEFWTRALYAAETTVRCKGDDGHWQFNTSNVAGNFITGGISNIYYPSTDRGFGLTMSRAGVVTAEGALGALFLEFWPDIHNKIARHRDKVKAEDKQS